MSEYDFSKIQIPVDSERTLMVWIYKDACCVDFVLREKVSVKKIIVQLAFYFSSTTEMVEALAELSNKHYGHWSNYWLTAQQICNWYDLGGDLCSCIKIPTDAMKQLKAELQRRFAKKNEMPELIVLVPRLLD